MKATNDITATVVSAVQLNDKEKQKVVEMLQKATGASLKPEYEVNPDILGGLRIEAGDWVFDTTVASQLKKLENVLEK